MQIPDNITGTTLNYYQTCKRESWLYSRKILANQDDENIEMGRILAELKENKKVVDFPLSNLKFDKIGKERSTILVTEHKKSLKNREGAKAQLLLYIYILKTELKLKKIKGKIVSGKKVILIEDSKENFEFLENLVTEILEFLKEEFPPEPKKIKYCNKCGYNNYCF